MRHAPCNLRARPAARGLTRARPRAGARAFSLLELLVALSMATIIAGSLYSALRIGFRARATAEAAVEPVRTAELATALLRADFESAMPARGTLAGPFVGADSTGGAGLSADTVEFFTLGNPSDAFGAAAAAAGLPAPGSGAGVGAGGMNGAAPAPPLPSEVRKVQIGLVEYPGPGGVAESVLVRRVTTNLLSQVEVEPEEEVLCRGVRAVNFRYFDGLTWQDTWDSTLADDHIPAAVEMVIELDRSTEGGERIIRFPRVYLLSCSTVASAATGTGAGTEDGTGTGAAGGTP